VTTLYFCSNGMQRLAMRVVQGEVKNAVDCHPQSVTVKDKNSFATLGRQARNRRADGACARSVGEARKAARFVRRRRKYEPHPAKGPVLAGGS
jgi:hypothetical protein